MANDEKSEAKEKILSIENKNILFNFILFKNGKTNKKMYLRRIFSNKEEKKTKEFTEEEYNLLEQFYNKVLKKYLRKINHSIDDYQENFIQDFNEFDKSNSSNQQRNIKSNLSALNSKFNGTGFYLLLYYNKKDIDSKQLLLVEYLCYLSIVFKDYCSSLEIIEQFIKYSPRYFLDDDFDIIDNQNMDKNQIQNDEGESGEAIEYYLFKEKSSVDKIYKSY